MAYLKSILASSKRRLLPKKISFSCWFSKRYLQYTIQISIYGINLPLPSTEKANLKIPDLKYDPTNFINSTIEALHKIHGKYSL